ncbi:unnamed protein product [Paramecium primaurelia]|uniref:Protein kinase domain-containing protein n=1 Tax=Paramecium primaurelia TaxID=5886 RepID=A0A8S1NZF3_PARPR|nr:unnamed protein product [Paramecium primaurelia]
MITESRGDYIVKFDKLLGKGSFGSAFICYRKGNPNEELCMKIIKKIELNDSDQDFKKKQLKAEINAIQELKFADCENLVKMIDMFELPQELCIIMELCDYDLYQEYNQLKQNQQWFSRLEQIDIIRQILKGTKILIENKFVHRDIKPQNILVKVVNKGKNNQRKIYKLADFGFARTLDDIYKKADLTRVGTFLYCAPEIIRAQNFSAKCDIFSYGVVFHQIVYKGQFPDNYLNQQQMQKFLTKIEKQPYICEKLQGDYGNLLTDLIQNMLLFNQDNRISFENLLSHQIVTLSLPMQQDSLFIQFDKKFNQQEIERQKIENKDNKYSKIDQLIDIFYRKSILCKSVVNYIKKEIIVPNIELLIIQQLIQIIGYEEIKFGFAMLHSIVSDLQPFIRNNHDIPLLINILQKYFEDSKTNQRRSKLHQKVKDEFYNQLKNFQNDYNTFILKIKQYPNNNQIKDVIQFMEDSQSQKIEINRCCLLLEEWINNQKISQQIIKFEQKIQQYIQIIKKIETKFDIANYYFINPNDIYEINNE